MQRLRETVQHWLTKADAAESPPEGPTPFGAARARPVRRFSRAQAQRAMETIDPQPIIEAMLSKEWAHHGMPRWLLAKQRVQELVRIHHAHLRPPRSDDTPFEHAKELINAAQALRTLWGNPEAGPLGQKPLFCVPAQSIDGREGRRFFESWQSLGEDDQWRFVEAVYCHSPGTEQLSTALRDELLWMFEELSKLDPDQLLPEPVLHYGTPTDEPEGLLPDLPDLSRPLDD
jgi:hypothetical protein